MGGASMIPIRCSPPFQELADKAPAVGDGQHDLPYEGFNGSGGTANQPYRRLIEHVRMLYQAAMI